MRFAFTIVAALLAAVPAVAGNTKISSDIGPIEPSCVQSGGLCNMGTCVETPESCTVDSDCWYCANTIGAAVNDCTIDSDCRRGDLQGVSKVKLDGKGKLKVVIKGFVDAAGVPVTTDGIPGTADDHVLTLWPLVATPHIPMNIHYAFVKLDFRGGKAKAKVGDVLALLGVTPGTVVSPMIALSGPPLVPDDCAGGNDPAALLARRTDTECSSGTFFGLGGVVFQ